MFILLQCLQRNEFNQCNLQRPTRSSRQLQPLFAPDKKNPFVSTVGGRHVIAFTCLVSLLERLSLFDCRRFPVHAVRPSQYAGIPFNPLPGSLR